jgi:hypothetical protein
MKNDKKKNEDKRQELRDLRLRVKALEASLSDQDRAGEGPAGGRSCPALDNMPDAVHRCWTAGS